jgi:DNA-binding CsgD family transcriptional regulator
MTLTTALASDPQYPISKQPEYLLERIAGSQFATIRRPQISEILRRAEAIYQVQFKQAAETKLANEIQELRGQGLNIVAVALKLGISRNLVSALVSGLPKKKDA